MIRYRLARLGLAKPGTPMNLTFSVTNLCQSRCKTCNIWELYRKNPEKYKTELTLSEIEQIFRSMGHIYIFNISGGEPFLREDITQIVESACRYLTPGIVHIPTNGISVDRILKRTGEILEMLQNRFPKVRLTVKPSLDHAGEKHDAIRGVPGNFRKVMTLFRHLQELREKHPNFHAELGTVISIWNVNDIEEIARFASSLGPDSYRHEIAENRSEMFNREHAITPSSEDYEKAVRFFIRQIRDHMKNKPLFQRMTHAFRMVYYDTAIRILKKNRQVIPCYGGISNAHLTPYGDIWACCTMGYDKPMGNLRDFSYDFQALWNNQEAKNVRDYIRKGNCSCPLANQAYSNLLLHGPSLLKVIWKIFKV